MTADQSPRKRPTPLNAAQAEKQRKALQLRIAGATFAEIAAQLGYADESGAYRLVDRALIETQRPPAEELRTLLTMRYERLLLALWPKATAGDVPSINAARRIVDSLAKLHLPIRFEGTVTQQTEADAAIAALVAELDRRAIGPGPTTVVATNGEPT